MKITVRYFASLRETLGKGEESMPITANTTVADVWAAAASGRPAPKVLAAINHEYADFTQVVHEGDEVAFFPPVTGG